MLDNKDLKNFHLLEQYEEQMATSKDYPVDKLSLIYPALGLNGEAGEVAEKVKKCWRDNNGVFTEDIKKAILKELADVLWYIWACADDMGYTLDDVLLTSMKKVKERQETNTVHGSGDDREKEIKPDKELMQKILSIPENPQINKQVLCLDIHDQNETSFHLSLRPGQKVVMEFFDNSNNDNKYEGIYKCASRISGGFIIDFGDEIKLNEITSKLNKIGENYLFYINGIQYKNVTYRIIDSIVNK